MYRTTYDSLTKEKAMNLLLNGISIPMVSEELNIPKTTLHDWLKKRKMMDMDSPDEADEKNSDVQEKIQDVKPVILKKEPGVDDVPPVRHTRTDKLTAIKRFRAGESLESIANEMKIQTATLQKWISMHNTPTKKKGRTHYDIKIKLGAVKRIRNGERTKDVAQSLGICPKLISAWVTSSAFNNMSRKGHNKKPGVADSSDTLKKDSISKETSAKRNLVSDRGSENANDESARKNLSKKMQAMNLLRSGSRPTKVARQLRLSKKMVISWSLSLRSKMIAKRNLMSAQPNGKSLDGKPTEPKVTRPTTDQSDVNSKPVLKVNSTKRGRKRAYHIEVKKAVVSLVKYGGKPLKSVCEYMDINLGTAKEWFKPRCKLDRVADVDDTAAEISPAIKLDAIRLVSRGEDQQKVAKDLGVSLETISDWMKNQELIDIANNLKKNSTFVRNPLSLKINRPRFTEDVIVSVLKDFRFVESDIVSWLKRCRKSESVERVNHNVISENNEVPKSNIVNGTERSKRQLKRISYTPEDDNIVGDLEKLLGEKLGSDASEKETKTSSSDDASDSGSDVNRVSAPETESAPNSDHSVGDYVSYEEALKLCGQI